MEKSSMFQLLQSNFPINITTPSHLSRTLAPIPITPSPLAECYYGHLRKQKGRGWAKGKMWGASQERVDWRETERRCKSWERPKKRRLVERGEINVKMATFESRGEGEGKGKERRWRENEGKLREDASREKSKERRLGERGEINVKRGTFKSRGGGEGKENERWRENEGKPREDASRERSKRKKEAGRLRETEEM